MTKRQTTMFGPFLRQGGPGWKPAPVRREPERVEQEAVKKLLAAMGAKFYVAGVTRKKGDYQGTMQTPGLPDLPLVFLPKFKAKTPEQAAAMGVPCMYELVVIEVKSPAAHKTKFGGLSPFQRECKAYCVGAGIPYIHGDLDALIGWLIDHGYLKAENVPHYRTGDSRHG